MDTYYLHVESDDYGHDEYGPYDTFAEAKAGRARIRKEARRLRDGIRRTYLIERR